MRHKRGEFTEAELEQQARWEAEAAEYRASELARTVVLPEIDPEGEALSEFITRAILKNPDFADSVIGCRSLNPTLDIRVPLAFCPCLLSAKHMAKVHSALAAFRGDMARPREFEALDAFWTGKFPLCLRMAMQPNPILDTADEAPEPLHPAVRRQLEIVRIAVQRRDGLMMKLLERLRTGAIIARGFLAADASRKRVEIPAECWDDPKMQCFWPGNELKLREEAPYGTQHYRGLQLSLAAESKPQASPTADRPKPQQKTVDAWMIEYYANAHSRRDVKPTRDKAFTDCRTAIGAVDAQMRKAMKKVPDQYKRKPGDKPNK